MERREGLDDIRKRLADGGRLCFFGLGVTLDEVYPQAVRLLGRCPDLFSDNDRERWGSIIRGRRCVSPLELPALGPNLVVLVMVKKYAAIVPQLRALGICHVYVLRVERGRHLVTGVVDWSLAMESGLDLVRSIRAEWTFVTGASRGLGRLLAVELAGLGSNVAVHARRTEHLEATIRDCLKHGVEVVALEADLSSLNEVDAMLDELECRTPRIDALINNAARSHQWESDFWGAPRDDFTEMFGINAAAPIRIAQRVIPAMIKRQHGRIIQVTSSLEGRTDQLAYAVSKAAVDKFVREVALALHGTGVQISSLDPGWLKTDMGGPDATCNLESALPGALIGMMFAGNLNGGWITAQEFAGLSLPTALRNVAHVYGRLKKECPSE